jgi:hypothetical protein
MPTYADADLSIRRPAEDACGADADLSIAEAQWALALVKRDMAMYADALLLAKEVSALTYAGVCGRMLM